MSHQSDLIAEDINEYLKQHEEKQLMRFLTCGSVDDGKSTLIGRLLYDSKMIYEDQLAAIGNDSKKHGTTEGRPDLALLVDGLQSEREQGITIDVAYRYFSTDKRKFIIADTPGHEQYTRNMATGASNCDVAIILIDARQGILTQTKRHSFIANLLGIRHIVVAINKMDLVDYSQQKFDEISKAYSEIVKDLSFTDIKYIPMSALEGDNVVNASKNTPWYQSGTLMQNLESIDISNDKNKDDFRFPVQYVNRPHLNFRGFCGQVVSGSIKPGDSIVSLPSGKESKIKALVTMDGDLEEAFPPLSITITTEDEIDISRGDMIVKKDNQPKLTNRVVADVVWMDEQDLVPNREYYFKVGTKETAGIVESVEYLVDVNTQDKKTADRVKLNEIARVAVRFNQEVAVDAYQTNRATGAFIFIDKLTNVTVGAGMIDSISEASENNQIEYSQAELELNAFVRKNYSHWGARDISQG
jgi:sulfate adenylyltransferase subunit 1